jgi:hypothetical protein
MTSKLKSAVALGLAGAIALGSASPTLSAPLPTATASIAAAAPDHVTDVRYRHRRGGAAFAGIALGLIGAGIAASTYPRYYYDPYPYPYDGYYGPSAYAPGPYYGYRHRRW